MLGPRSALFAVFGVASIARAGVVISLVPTSLGPYDVANPASLGPFNIDIYLSQDPEESPRGLRFVRFDLADTSPQIILPTQMTFRYTNVVLGGAMYSQSRDLPLPSTVYNGTDYPNGEWPPEGCYNPPYDCSDVNPWSQSMLVLPPSGAYRVATLVGVTLPVVPPDPYFLIDVVNSDFIDPVTGQPDPNNRGARIDYGFGLQPSDPHVVLQPGSGLTGGQIRFVILPEPATLMLLGLVGVAVAVRRRTTGRTILHEAEGGGVI